MNKSNGHRQRQPRQLYVIKTVLTVTWSNGLSAKCGLETEVVDTMSPDVQDVGDCYLTNTM